MLKTPGTSGLMMPNRRQLLKGAGATGAMMLAAPAILLAQTTTITVPNSGGALEEAYRKGFFDTFEAQTGVKVLTAPYMEAGRVKAMVEANAVDVDILNIDFAEAAVLQRENLLEPVDYSVVDKSDVPDWAASEQYIVSDVAALVMAWNTEAIDAASRPKTWAEFYDTATLPGQRGLWKLAMQTLETACLGAGIDPKNLYPLDLDAAFAMLDKLKPDLTWWTSGAQSSQLLISSEIDMGAAWNGRVHGPKLEGAPVDFTFDQSIWTCDAWIIPKGAKNKDLAMQFMANIFNAKNQAVVSQNMPYGPTVQGAFDLLSDAEKAVLPNAPDNSKTAIVQDVAYWAAEGDAVFKRFNEWLA